MAVADRPALVGVVMGSDSDLPVVREAFQTLDRLGVSWEARILSAHRTPEEAVAYAREAEARGLRVLVAAAGGAAHLPGVLAACTVLPVIGLPVRGRALEGLDALLSMVQMPPGVPVAVVAVDGARNAALLAAAVLAAGDQALRERLRAYRAELAASVRERDRRLQELGPAAYGEDGSAGKGLGR